MRDGEMMLRLLKQAADEEHGRVILVRTMRSGHKGVPPSRASR